MARLSDGRQSQSAARDFPGSRGANDVPAVAVFSLRAAAPAVIRPLPRALILLPGAASTDMRPSPPTTPQAPRVACPSTSMCSPTTGPDRDELSSTRSAPRRMASRRECRRIGAYAPAAGFEGNDAFSYTISDGQGGTATAKCRSRVIARVRRRAPRSHRRGSGGKLAQGQRQSLRRSVDAGAATRPGRRRGFGSPRKIISAWGSMAWDSNRQSARHLGRRARELCRQRGIPVRCRGILRWHRASLPSAVHAPFRRPTLLRHRRRAGRRADLPRTRTTTRNFCR